MTDRERLAPLCLAPNYPAQAYAGGGLVAQFRGVEPDPSPRPEDWVASTTTRWNSGGEGLSRLGNGQLLRDLIEESPERYLGPRHVARYGPDPGLLVKLLDAAERLVVHCHPDREFAARHLGCVHGKTEAWLILEAREGAEVHLGFRRPIESGTLEGWVANQEVGSILGALHHVQARPGAAILVPAGVPHAIDGGILLIELQEPTDFSVTIEQGGFAEGDLGLGMEVALGCVDRSRWTVGRLAELFGPGLSRDGAVLPDAAAPFFRAERVVGGSGGRIARGYAVAVVIGGSGHLTGDFPGGCIPLSRGATVLLPYEVGSVGVDGGLEVVVCRPPV